MRQTIHPPARPRAVPLGRGAGLRAQETAPNTDAAGPVPKTINEMRRRNAGLTDTHNLFVPKGQWVFGGTASYSTHTNDNYKFLVVEGIDSKGTHSASAP